MGIWDQFFERAKKLLGTKKSLNKRSAKLALKWHPDKNPDRLDECAAYFVILKQAYEVLCDPQERAFYDRHRENIIYGGEGAEETKDTGLNLDKFFERSCFQGFGDDETGFYTIYRNCSTNWLRRNTPILKT
uniref:J domain-containing protein n=1 Tax=Ditylenchus dipsaci TaxID=166011 RepID=A0A915DT69_9BILA